MNELYVGVMVSEYTSEVFSRDRLSEKVVTFLGKMGCEEVQCEVGIKEGYLTVTVEIHGKVPTHYSRENYARFLFGFVCGYLSSQ